MSPDHHGFHAPAAALATDIAIVGMAGRFPGAPDLVSFWRNLREGVESVTTYSDADLLAAGVPKHLLDDPDYVRVGAPLADMELFDAALFGLTPREAAIMDPQHRHFLECAWEAIENAGYDTSRFPGPVGVFAGSGHNAYLPYNLLSNPDLVRSTGMFMLRHTGNDKDFLTTRLSYLLNLKGPSVAVQTACSSSLVAIHLAAQSLLALECDMALAGGVTIELPHRHGYLYEEGGVTSRDGHCRPFDRDASGTVFGSGVGMVVLRRLSDAIESGDHIHAVIKGSAINNDGSGKVGYFAPSVDGQAHAIMEALTIAGVAPDTISYVEAHGTGTPVGDPIEVAALTMAFRSGTADTNFCAIGSLKGNVGHLDTAAGVAGVIKVALALSEGELPPSINYSAPNDACDMEDGPFYVASALRPWTSTTEAPLRAGVSSLGVGGTNAHLIMEQAPPRRAAPPVDRPQLLVLSAASESALDAGAVALADHLALHSEQDLGSVAYTLDVGRKRLPYRRSVVATTREAAIAALRGSNGARPHAPQGPASARSIAFMFAGGGAQHPNMGLGLYRSEAVFRDAVCQCLDLLGGQQGSDLRTALYPPPGREAEAAAALERPSIGLPALFVIQYAQAKLWQSWGVVPAGMIGHSMGEYVVAHLAGVFTLGDALRLVQRRGQLFERLPPGAMLSVPLGVDDLAPHLPPVVSIAAINGERATVVSGPVEAITQLRLKLLEIETPSSLLRINVAAHSAMLEPMLPAFAEFLGTIRLHAPKLAFVSSLTGRWVTADQVQDPAYWVRHLREPVRFHAGLACLLDGNDHVLLEVGPGRVLVGHALQHPSRAKTNVVIASSRHVDDPVDDMVQMLDALGRLWAAGAPVDLDCLHAGTARLRVPLPTYRFDHVRHWIEPGRGAAVAEVGDPQQRRNDIADWFYCPSWIKTQPAPDADSRHTTLIFADRCKLGTRLAEAARLRGDAVVMVHAGHSFTRLNDDEYRIRCDVPEDYARLIASLATDGKLPDLIYHLWSVTGPQAERDPMKSVDTTLALGFYSLLYLAQAIGADDASHAIDLVVVSDGMQRVCDEQAPSPTKATLLGPCRVIPRELPNIRARSVDVRLPRSGSASEAWLIDALLAEPYAEDHAETVALRHRERWVQQFAPVRPSRRDKAPPRIKPGGTYVITGGLGEIGLALGQHLAATAETQIALVTRRSLPPRELWPAMLTDRTRDARDVRCVRQILAMEQSGSRVLLVTADVADRRAMQKAIRDVRAAFGPIHGVFHAAGILDDGLIQLKDATGAARVLAPKVHGTLSLHAALAKDTPDFVMLFSSVSASLGAAGQVDYAGANAFLDAFAQAVALKDSGTVVAVDWSQWQDIGMAAALARGGLSIDVIGDDAGAASDYPLLDTRVSSPREYRFATRFNARRHWLLDEHRVLGDGKALIPGTGFIEIIRAAADTIPRTSSGAPGIQDVLFLEPFFVEDDADRDLHIHFSRGADDMWQFELTSQSSSGATVSHVRGHLSHAAFAEPDRLPIATIRARCRGRAAIVPSAHMKFGPRWSNVTEIAVGQGEALLTLVLPPAFVADLDTPGIHPALLDLATAGAQMICPGLDPARDFFVPASYAQIRLYSPMTATMVSHVRLLPEACGADVACYDVTISDVHGLVIADIREFTMVRVQGRTMAAPEPAVPLARAPTCRGNSPTRAATHSTGIRTDEGMAVIDCLLTQSLGAQIVVAPQDFVASLAAARTPSAVSRGAARDSSGAGDDDPGRTAMTKTERLIADMWRDMLGVDRLSPADNFFDLGGHSLLAVQFINKLRKRLGVPVPVTALIETPTLGALAARFEPAASPGMTDDEGSAARPAGLGRDAVMIAGGGRATPLFLVHDGLGEILLYRTLATRIGDERPIYGLQPEVRADGSFIHTAIATMAAAHIVKIRQVQPKGPYLLAGLCAGGVIAFEMARQLEDLGEAVWYVGIIDAADVEARERPFFVARLRLKRFAALLTVSRLSDLATVSREITAKAWRFLRYEHEDWRHRRRMQRQVNDLRAPPGHSTAAIAEGTPRITFLDLYKIAHRQHRPHGLLHNAHVVLYRARAGTGAPDDMPFSEQFSDCALGWGARVADGVEILTVPGGHVSALQEPNVATLAEAIREGLYTGLSRGRSHSIAAPSPAVAESDDRPSRALAEMVES